MDRLLTVMVLAAALTACTDQPFSRQVQAGSSMALTLTLFQDGTTPGYGSRLAGPDPQRGQFSFVLCVPETDCDPSPSLSPRQGYRLETAYVTRLHADRLSATANEGAVAMAALDIPGGSDPQRPPPGSYELEGRVTLPDGQERLVLSRRPTVTVIAGEGVRTDFALTGPDQSGNLYEQPLLDAVPPPALRLIVADDSQPLPAAAEVSIRYPSAVSVSRAVEVGSLGAGSLVRVADDPGTRTARVRLLDPDRRAQGVALAFTLNAGASPVSAGDFSIVDQTLYDLDGNPMPGQSLTIADIR